MTLADDTLTVPIPTLSGSSSRGGTGVRTTTWLRLLVVPLAIAVVQAPWWFAALTQWPRQGALDALLVVPLLAGMVGWRHLHVVPRGPQIHDRQLDLILCAGFTALAAELLHLTDEHGGASFYGVGSLLASTTAIMIVGWGTRAVWQLKGSLAVLLLVWQGPWQAAVTATAPDAARLATSFGGDRLDPLLGGGVLLPVCVGLVCGLSGAAACRGLLRRVATVLAGLTVGLAVAAGEWSITGWMGARSTSAAAAWTTGAVQLWTVLAVVPLLIGAVAGRALWRRTVAHRPASSGGGMLQASQRLTTAVPRARFATCAVVLLAVGLLVLTARALPLSGVTL